MKSIVSLPSTDVDITDNPNLQPIKTKWEEKGVDVVSVLVHTAKEPSLSLAYNYASLLLNNSFFLESLVSHFSHCLLNS
jgi:superoxide dismutase, Fe-Mn family